jgi:hypothetical protein
MVATALLTVDRVLAGRRGERLHKGAGEAAVHPVSGLPSCAANDHGWARTLVFRVEVARTAPEQAGPDVPHRRWGGRGDDLFFANPPRGAFWMRNTVIPLDIIFVGRDHKIMQHCSKRSAIR